MPNLVYWKEIPEGRVLEEDERGRLKATRVFRLWFDSINVGESYALYASGLPRRWDSYEGPDEYCFGLRCVRRRVVQDTSDHFVWLATIEYDTYSADPAQVSAQSGEGSAGSPLDENPLLMPPKIVWGAVHDSKVIEKSISHPPTNVRAVLNSAGQPFRPRPTVDNHRMTLTYTRNEAEYDASGIQAYWDTVNDRPFAGFFSRQLKLSHTSAQIAFRTGRPYWEVTYYFEARLPDWDLHILDKGTMELDADNIPVRIIQSGAASEDTLLDGEGHRLFTIVAPPDVQPAPIVLDFYAYEESDFYTLGLQGL